MKPTIASDARSRRSASPTTPITSPPSSPRKTPAGASAGSAQPSSPKQGVVKGTSKSKGSPSRKSRAAREQPSCTKSDVGTSSETRLTAGERKGSFESNARALREDRMGAEMARIAKEKDLINDETAANWSTPWHAKGEVVQSWSEETRTKYNGENAIVPEEVMSLEEALRIKAKKDADQEEFVAAFEARLINENGVVIASGEKFEAGMFNRHNKSNERQQMRNADIPKKELLKKVTEGRVTKSTASKKSSELNIIDETSSFAKKAVAKAPKAASKSDGKESVSKATSKSTSASPSPIVKEKSLGEPDNDDNFCLLPRPGLPNYQAFKYYDLTALLRDRNIRSGGREERCRNRLIQDDIYIIDQQWDMRDARNWNHQQREVKTEAPTVPNMPVAPPAKLTAAMKKARKAGYTPVNFIAKPSALPTATKPQKRARDEEDDDEASSDKTAAKKVKTT